MSRPRFLLRFPLLAVVLLGAAACLPLHADNLVDIDVVDRVSGQWLPEYPHRGRVYVAGEPGQRYAVRLGNRSGERVLVVLSVDGVNTVSGETAAPTQAGYVLEPWETAEITGWRKSLDDVAQFHFTDLPDSYAARTGRPNNVGVIGIAAFRERRYRPPHPLPGPPIAEDEAARPQRSAATAAAEAAADPAYQGNPPRQRIGTGHGAREWAPVGRTQFVRASTRPAQVTELHYDDAGALAALGIVPRPPWNAPDWRVRRDGAPRAFPDGFVADPPGW